MDNKDEEYYRYLLSSEVGMVTAQVHREIVAEYFWNIFRKYKCKEVLDMGCGLGFFIQKAGEGINVLGVDSNSKVVEHCRTAGINVILANAAELPIENSKQVDGIMCAHLLEHLQEPEKAFQEFRRVLKVGGVVIVRVPPFDSSFYDDWTHVRPFTKKTLVRLATVYGFKIIRVFFYHYDIPFRYRQNIFFRFVNLMRHLPGIQAIVDAVIRVYGLPPKELVLIAEKK